MISDVFCHVYVLQDVCFAVIYAIYVFWVRFCAAAFLRSLVLWSRSMWSTAGCFMVPLHNVARTVSDLDCFTVSLWTGVRLSPGLDCVAFMFVRLPALSPFISPSHILTCWWTYFLTCLLSLHALYVKLSFSITETFRHPFLDVQVF